MTLYYCECDPHGDNARCDRPCCKPRHIQAAEAAAIVEKARRLHEKPKPSPEDLAEAVETLRMLASRVRSAEVAERLTRVAAWMEGVDIVEELRLMQTGAQWACGATAATLGEAADEIERLRAALRPMLTEATLQGWREDCVLAVMLDDARAALGENKR